MTGLLRRLLVAAIRALPPRPASTPDMDRAHDLERLVAERDAARRAEREMRDMIGTWVRCCDAAQLDHAARGKEIASACAAAHRWRMRAAWKTGQVHRMQRDLGGEVETLKRKLTAERLRSARWKRAARALWRECDVLRALGKPVSR